MSALTSKIPMAVRSQAQTERLMQQWNTEQSFTTQPISFEAWLAERKA